MGESRALEANFAWLDVACSIMKPHASNQRKQISKQSHNLEKINKNHDINDAFISQKVNDLKNIFQKIISYIIQKN